MSLPDVVGRALGDPTRRTVIERLALGPATVSELAAPFSMALPSFQQHLRVLEDAGLIRSEKVGRTRVCRLDPGPLRALETWLSAQRATWEARLDRLDAFLLTMEDEP